MEDLDKFGYFDVEQKAIDKIKKKHKKLLIKVYKKILKQIKKDPMQNYLEINNEDYSFKEMKIIKRYFCDWEAFGFSKTIPGDDLVEVLSYGYVTTSTCNTAVSTISSTETPTIKPITKFYITWFV